MTKPPALPIQVAQRRRFYGVQGKVAANGAVGGEWNVPLETNFLDLQLPTDALSPASSLFRTPARLLDLENLDETR